MLEKTVKFFFRISLMVLALFGVRHVLGMIGVVIPLEWFIVMVAGMLGFYGVIVIILYALIINFL